MQTLINLIKRNLLMFFRNKSAVFFSFLSVIIIIGLYVLFLSDLQVQNIEATVGKVTGIKALVNSWVMAGLIAVSTVTLAMGALGRIVSDRENKTFDDFLVAPVSRSKIFLSYILSALIITTILSVTMLVIAELYILVSGGELLSVINLLKVIGTIILCVLSSSLFILFIVSFLASEQSVSVLATIVGTLIGFVTSAYIPVGILPKGIQIFSNLIPVSQGASLLRKIFLETPSREVFGNATQGLKEYYEMNGVSLHIGNFELTANFMILYIIGSIILFGILNIIRFKKMKNI